MPPPNATLFMLTMFTKFTPVVRLSTRTLFKGRGRYDAKSNHIVCEVSWNPTS
jgi:hypothetical protein